MIHELPYNFLQQFCIMCSKQKSSYVCKDIFFQCFYSQSLIYLAQDSSEDWELEVSRFTQGQTLRTIFFCGG